MAMEVEFRYMDKMRGQFLQTVHVVLVCVSTMTVGETAEETQMIVYLVHQPGGSVKQRCGYFLEPFWHYHALDAGGC